MPSCRNKVILGCGTPPTRDQQDDFARIHSSLKGFDPSLAADLGQGPMGAWIVNEKRFRDEVGIASRSPSTRDLLRGCAAWLSTQGVLSNDELPSLNTLLTTGTRSRMSSESDHW